MASTLPRLAKQPTCGRHPIVAADVDANAIGPLLRTGIPQTPKSSADAAVLGP